MSKARVFECPNCGASLEYEGGDEPTVRCDYCGSSVIVPDELRDKQAALEPSIFGLSPNPIAKLREIGRLVRANRKIEAVKLYREMFGVSLQQAKDAIDELSQGKTVHVGDMTIKTDGLFESALLAFPTEALEEVQLAHRAAQRTSMIMGLGATGIVLLILGTIVVVTLLIVGVVALATGVTVRQASTPPSFAQVALTFGGEGTGPGLFTDARHVAVDGEGNIYVGEYSDGRIQVFDRSGEFVSLWMIDADTPLRGLAADRQGIVYVVQGGEIFRYEGATGTLLGQVEYAEGWGFDDIAMTADGGFVAAWYRNRDDIVRFDAQGNVLQTIDAAISGQTGDAELNTRVAVDGLGNIYALGTFNTAVFKFAPDGRFVTRFGSRGSEPGQFGAPDSIAVDGLGRVYVGDTKGIQVFDADGRYLDLIEVEGPAFGMAFNDQNELLVAARHRVVKYVLAQPDLD